MSLEIEQREVEGIVLDLKGPIALGHGDLELRDRLPALHQSGKVNIVLNLKEVRLAIAFEFFNDERDAVSRFFADREQNRFDMLSFVESEDGRGSDNAVRSAEAC